MALPPHILKRHYTNFINDGMRRVNDLKLKMLEDRARNYPNDAYSQYIYMKEVMAVDPDHAIRWYHKRCSHLRDSRLDKLYEDAMHKARQMSFAGDVGGSGMAGRGGNGGAELGSDFGTKKQPLFVQIDDGEPKSGYWLTRVFKFGFYCFLGYIMFSTLKGLNSSRMLGGKEYLPEKSNQSVRFDDVQGCDEAKEELQEVVQFLQDPEKFQRLGAKIPCGLLLVGPPGTGKTLLAKAIAGEANVPFFFVSGSEFDEMFVGVGASRIRKLFEAAKEASPSIIFIDELDAVGGKRSNNEVSPYARMTLNQLLVELDGFAENQGVIVIGATNFPEVLDKALVRPGRFDSRVHVTKPDVKGRTDILRLYINKNNCADDVDEEVIARTTMGFTGADLSNLVNQAALRAASLQVPLITMEHFSWARDKIIMGPERKSAVIEQSNLINTAYHESGHAVVAIFTKDAQAVHKATIVPRGSALGYVMQLPDKDELSQSKKQLHARMDVCMGGRVAEELIFGEDSVTTGASSDMEQASAIARAMVTKYGMSDKVGTVLIDENQDKISPDLQNLIESEVKRLVDEAYARAKNILQKHAKEHRLLAEGLLKYETLDAKQIELVIKGKALNT